MLQSQLYFYLQCNLRQSLDGGTKDKTTPDSAQPEVDQKKVINSSERVLKQLTSF